MTNQKPSSVAPQSLSEQIADYLMHLLDSPRTQHTYETGLRAFQVFLQEKYVPRSSVPTANHSMTIDLMDTNVLQDFQLWLAQNDYSRFSHKTYLSSVLGFLNYALTRGWLPRAFSFELARAKLKQIKRRGAYPIPRPDPALPRLIRYYDDFPLPDGEGEKARRSRLQILRSRAFVHLLYSSAGRLAEVAALNRKDVGDGRRKEAIVTGKGDKERFIFITPDARAAIAVYVSERQDAFEPLFISHSRDYGKRLSHEMLWRTVSRAAKKLNMDVSPHDFRHYRARQMLEQGAPLEAIQEILGHSDIGTTRRVYAHYSKPSIRNIFERTTLSPQDAARRVDEQEQETD